MTVDAVEPGRARDEKPDVGHYRAVPQQPRTLTNDEVYALTAYILAQNKLTGENDVITATTLPKVRMPNRDGFIVRFPEKFSDEGTRSAWAKGSSTHRVPWRERSMGDDLRLPARELACISGGTPKTRHCGLRPREG